MVRFRLGLTLTTAQFVGGGIVLTLVVGRWSVGHTASEILRGGLTLGRRRG